jgi:HK97 family phage major capsid protein
MDYITTDAALADSETAANRGDVHKVRAYRNQLIERGEQVIAAAKLRGTDLTDEQHRELQIISDRAHTAGKLLSVAEQRETSRAAAAAPFAARVEHSGSSEWDLMRSGRSASLTLELGARLANRTRLANGRVEHRDLLTSNVAAVPTKVFDQLILSLVQQSGVLQAGPRTINSGDGADLKVPIVSSYGTASIISEGSAISESDPTVSTVTLSSYNISRLLQVSEQLLTDASFDMERYLGEELGTSVGLKLGALLATGTGSSQPQGVIGTATTTGVTGGTGVAGAPTVANLINLYHSVPSQYRGETMSWIMHSDTMSYIANLTDSHNRPLLLPSLSADVPSTLMGRPVYIDSNVPAYGTAVRSIWVGDMSRFLAVRYAGPLRIDASRDFAFANALVTYRVQQRIDSKIVESAAARVFLGGAS